MPRCISVGVFGTRKTSLWARSGRESPFHHVQQVNILPLALSTNEIQILLMMANLVRLYLQALLLVISSTTSPNSHPLLTLLIPSPPFSTSPFSILFPFPSLLFHQSITNFPPSIHYHNLLSSILIISIFLPDS